jgi:cytochrome c oxidase assembly protein subunit 11
MIVATNITSQNGNRRTGIILCILVLAMVGLSYASVPLYDLFCRVTGYGGTTQVANTKSNQIVLSHPVDVRFDANVNAALNWKFVPLETKVTVNPGEEVIINYRATNLGKKPTTGTSTFNVTPVKAGTFFMKLDCFCFIEQTLQPGQSVDMPVRFFVDPEIVADENAKDIGEIILSYTFFPALGGDPAKDGKQ